MSIRRLGILLLIGLLAWTNRQSFPLNYPRNDSTASQAKSGQPGGEADETTADSKSLDTAPGETSPDTPVEAPSHPEVLIARRVSGGSGTETIFIPTKPDHPLLSAAPNPLGEKAAVALAEQSTALVEGRYGRGSGFLVLPNLVVTNSHVVLCEMMEDVTIRFATNGVPEKKSVKARLLYEDKKRDLAFLWLDENQTRAALPLARSFNPADCPNVAVIGSPRQALGVALVNVVEHAICEEEVAIIDGQTYYRLAYHAGMGDRRIERGNSGGPVVNSQGELIGVLTIVELEADKPVGRAYCIPSSDVEEAFEQIGHPETWSEKSELVEAKHACDIAAVSLHLNAMVAYDTIVKRVETPGLENGLSWSFVRRRDQDFINDFRSVNKKFLDFTLPKIKIGIANGTLYKEQLNEINNLRRNLAELRDIAGADHFQPFEYNKSKTCYEKCQQSFAEFRNKSGIPSDIVGIMTKDIAANMGVKINIIK